MTKQERTSERLCAGALPDPGTVDNLIEQASDIAVMVDDSGVVSGISVSPECPSLGCLDHWVGRAFTSFLTPESEEKFTARRRLMLDDPTSVPRPVELNHLDNATWEFPVRYTLHRVGERAMLLLGRDMQPVAEVQQKLLREQQARERDQQRLRGGETYYRVVLEASETPMALVDPESGRIRDINSAAAHLLGSKPDTLAGTAFAQAFEGRRRGEFMEAVQSAAQADETKGVEVVARRNGRVVMVFPEFFRASGDLVLLCRINLVDEKDATGPEFTQALAALFAASSDAIVLTDAKGVIRDANEAFLIMADAAQLRDVKDQSLSEFLSRGTVDLKLILETAAKSGRMRSYAAQVKSIVGTRAPVAISAARLRHRGGDLGFGLILREQTPSDYPAAEGAVAVSDEAMKNVMDLVGTASLKELVSATSDVVEKMCIETAVQLTGNNRVAAAEMLGLSRQSLYVKLRKYGMLNSDSEG
ncbi:MAG TPA: transcriptional regulator PpsR [Roseovarius sp.]|nr:transcriptional regulator PpsR [Roseovarius sp.]HMB12989.1 transcriptional regulator PpsR [Roseovarius sp.]